MVCLVLLLAAASACTEDGGWTPADPDGTGSADAHDATPDPGSPEIPGETAGPDGPEPTDAGADGEPDDGPPPPRAVSCADAPPPGAELPPPLPAYSNGACPTLVPGVNLLRSGADERPFILVLPSDYDGSETLPLVVMYHYLGGAADSMLTHGEVQESADRLRFIAAIPEKLGDLALDLFGNEFDPAWPYLTGAAIERVEREALLFDDLLACIVAQYAVNTSCISAAGVSAGALWVSQLAQVRGERLASVIVISGGVGPATGIPFIEVRDWRGAAHAMPMLVGWGGAGDQCAVNFDTASRNLEAGLVAGGHFVMECVHNCGHAAPPVDPAVGLPVLWRFALDHPYWLRDGESPYLATGMPEGAPDWCGLGAGGAVPRTESCGEDGFGGTACPVPAL